MFINIRIFSKNLNSIKVLSKLFSNKTFAEAFNVATVNKSFYIKTFSFLYTILKSPHVNKTAQEHFEQKIYNRQFKIYSSQNFIVLSILKFIKSYIFPDISFKIEITSQPYRYRQKVKNQINSDNFLLCNKSSGLKNYITILNNYGKTTLKLRNGSNSSVG
jgi:hypothetical protein